MADEGTALVPVREQAVDFYGDQVLAAQLADGTILVPLRPLCEALGLEWSAQTRRVRRDPALAPAAGVAIMATPSGRQAMLCLPLKLLPGWLFGVTVSKVRPELREKILRYQQDCYEVLWNAFKADILPAPPPSDLAGAELALEIAEAVAALARQHLDLERRYTTMADYMRGHVRQTNLTLADHADRLQGLELRLGGGATISEVEAQELQQAVKQVAMALHQHTGQPVSTAFQLVWGELYKRYRVGAYRNLPTARYAEALAWLHGWYEELEGQGS